MEVIRHGDLKVTRFTNPFKGANTFLLEDENAGVAWIFDVGDSEEMLSATESLEIDRVFVTHAHFDHIKGIKHFCDKHPGCRICAGSRCIEWLADDRRNLSFYYEHPLDFVPVRCVRLEEGHILQDTDLLSMRAYSTPGHTEDSMTYGIGDILVTGDAFIPGVPPVTKLKGGDKHKYAHSVDRIKELITERTLLLPGHGPMFAGYELI